MAKDILKEAIADAKAVREVALANAKAALEEAFTPKLQSMLSHKLSEKLDEDYVDDEKDLELGEIEYDEDYGEEDSMDEEIDLEEILNELELEGGDEADDEVVAEGDDEEEDLDEIHRPHYEADEVQLVNPKAEYVHEDKEFDLDALLKEINDLDDAKLTPRGRTRKGKNAPTNKTVGIPKPFSGLKHTLRESKGCREKSLKIVELRKELKSTKNAFDTVKGELNEVNLLNSKLLYVNRIFKVNTLDDAQKLRVVETLDKADSTKEAKLIYETIKNSFSIAKTEKVVKKQTNRTIKESFRGMASKATGISRTKKVAPKKAIISESDNMINRFQKLANIKISE